jgi:PAS domain-containing protein
MAVSIVLAFVQNQLVVYRLIDVPLMISPAFVLMVGGMAYQLGHDILRARQLAIALHESEERLSLAASAGLGIWVLNPSKLTVWATDQARVLFGFRNDESLAYERWTSRVHPI